MKPMVSDLIQARVRGLTGIVVVPAIITRVVTPDVDTKEQHVVVDATAFGTGTGGQSYGGLQLFDLDPGDGLEGKAWWPVRPV